MSEKSIRQKKCEEFRKFFKETILEVKDHFDREFAEIKDSRKPRSLRGNTYHISGDIDHLKYIIRTTLYENKGEEFVNANGSKVRVNFLRKEFLPSAPGKFIKIGDVVNPKKSSGVSKVLSSLKLDKAARVVGFETVSGKHEQNVLLEKEDGEVFLLPIFDAYWDELVVTRP